MGDFIHNKRKSFYLRIVNSLFEILWLRRKLFPKRIDFQNINPKKILLVRLDNIGDVIMTSPAFAAVRKRFPDAEVLLLTNYAGKQLYDTGDFADKVFEFNWPWPYLKKNSKFSTAKIQELIKLIKNLRKEKIDLFIDFRGDIRFVVLFGVLTGAKIRMGNSRMGNTSLLDYSAPYDINKHEVEKSLDIIKAFTKSKQVIRPHIAINDLEVDDIKHLVKNEIKAEFPQKLALIVPYSSQDIKSWPLNNFKDVIENLSSKGFTVIVTGTGDDIANADRMVKGFSNTFSFAGKTTIKQAAALAAISNLVVGVDTGGLHIASCFKVPIIAIFGSTRSLEYGPYSPYAVVVEHKCQCNQFLHLTCDYEMDGYSKCLSNVSSIQVIAAIDRVLN